MALPYHLYVISTQVPNVDEKIRYGTALVLLFLVLFMNLIAIIISVTGLGKRRNGEIQYQGSEYLVRFSACT